VRPSRAPAREIILPGFIDLQINGGFGIDVMAADAEQLLRLARELVREGTTAWLPAVITAPLETIERCDRIIGDAMAYQRELERAARRGSRATPGATILGMHLEGPFISPLRLGAHPRENLAPQGEALERVLGLKSIRLITIAPELEGAAEAIRRLTARGVTVALGHTDAGYEAAVKGLEAGATMITHLFNAMRPLHHREPGVIGAAAHKLRPCAMMIADGVHVAPSVMRLCRGLRTALVTDRVASAGAKQAPATIFGRPARDISHDSGAARYAGGTLFGSTISMLDAARMARSAMGCDWAAVAALTSGEAARALKLRNRGRIAPGGRADMVMVDPALKVKGVWTGGRESA
jgi:N-acetylglucosamine-6-phosphate deacetylase